jgi:alanine racemase
MRLPQELAGNRPLWPAIKANAYGHGAQIVARHLVSLGYGALCVAHVSEAVALLDAGVKATFIILSAALPARAAALVAARDAGMRRVLPLAHPLHGAITLVAGRTNERRRA